MYHFYITSFTIVHLSFIFLEPRNFYLAGFACRSKLLPVSIFGIQTPETDSQNLFRLLCIDFSYSANWVLSILEYLMKACNVCIYFIMSYKLLN